MKIFAIRIENGNTVLTLAADEQEALKKSGLDEDAFASASSQGWRGDHASLVESGLGQQKYEIIEVQDFQIVLSLSEDGEYKIEDIGIQTWEALDSLYPILDAVSERLADSQEKNGLPDRDEYFRQIAEAVSQERTRLSLPNL